jgi:hypothetical protein
MRNAKGIGISEQWVEVESIFVIQFFLQGGISQLRKYVPIHMVIKIFTVPS